MLFCIWGKFMLWAMDIKQILAWCSLSNIWPSLWDQAVLQKGWWWYFGCSLLLLCKRDTLVMAHVWTWHQTAGAMAHTLAITLRDSSCVWNTRVKLKIVKMFPYWNQLKVYFPSDSCSLLGKHLVSRWPVEEVPLSLRPPNCTHLPQ